MSVISSWAASVCTVAIICALFDMLVPEGNTTKMLNFVLGTFLVVAIIIPFVDIVKSGSFKVDDIRFDDSNYTLIQQNEDLTLEVGKSTIENIIAKVLQEKNIAYKKIVINMDSSTNKSIDIIRAEIYINSTNRNRLVEIQRIVKEQTGITPELIVG
ncbi:MAG: stage III sporulation protein AF [Acutalibacteraceae bacterium]|nr:stage III sporulation protein AF [Acutalibacteraceae bacterium]